MRGVFCQANDGALAEMELRLRRAEFVPHHEELPQLRNQAHGAFSFVSEDELAVAVIVGSTLPCNHI